MFNHSNKINALPKSLVNLIRGGSVIRFVLREGGAGGLYTPGNSLGLVLGSCFVDERLLDFLLPGSFSIQQKQDQCELYGTI